MRVIKRLISIGGFFVLVGAVFLLMDRKGNSETPPQLEKSAMWEDDVLVHSGQLTQYPRNGYSSDYDLSTGNIYVGVVGYAGVDPDTCFVYQSIDEGYNWSLYYTWVDPSNDISNPQVVIGQGQYRYLFLFGRVEEENGNILVNRKMLPIGGWFQYPFSGSPRGIKNFVVTREQGPDYYLHLAYDSDSGDVFYVRSTNYGVNWMTYDTVDGDMPHLAVGGVDGSEDIFLTWRLDGPKGALYTADNHGMVKKNKEFLNNKWYSTGNMPTSDNAYCIYQHDYDGCLYVGTGNDGDVYKSENGGETWTLTGDLSGAEYVDDLVGKIGDSILLAATGEPARIFLTIDGGNTWTKVKEFSDQVAFLCLAYDRTAGHFYAGTTPGGGVYKSINNGYDWFETAELPGLDKVRSIIVTENGIVLAAGEKTGDTSRIFRSTNGGNSWVAVGPYLDYYYCFLQAVNETIYASGAKVVPSRPILLKSGDDGVSWSYLPDPPIVPYFIYEDSYSNLYIGNSYSATYKSTNKGTFWQPFSGSVDVTDMIQSRPQIAVRRSLSPNRGSVWEAGKIVSQRLYDLSDPKIAAGQGTSDYKIWVAYSQEHANGWNLKFSLSTDQGASWSKDRSLRSHSQLPVLKVNRGTSGPLHAAFICDDDGTDKAYYAAVSPANPFDWYSNMRMGEWTASTLHSPEITFVSSPSGPGVFYCQLFGIPPKTMNLRFDAQHFTEVEEEEEEESRAREFSLSQNYPNPFNPTTTIRFKVEGQRSKVPDPTTQGKAVDGSQFMVRSPVCISLKIYNMLGQVVRTLVDDEKVPGSYEVTWDGKDEQGNEVASGIYFCKLEVGDKSQTKKMVLMK
jgi:photosystem II stability/assembly factor-like uncharacterized protein